jgi:hypothetical protein
MSQKILSAYLNDHLAGSVAALELLDHVAQLQQGTPVARVLTGLRTEIEEDQKVLQNFLHGLGGSESRLRHAAAWLSEKVGRAKLLIDDPGTGELRLLEALEALALGIQGKAGLWRALRAISRQLPPGQQLDFSALEGRALTQFEKLDRLRLDAAAVALSFSHDK